MNSPKTTATIFTTNPSHVRSTRLAFAFAATMLAAAPSLAAEPPVAPPDASTITTADVLARVRRSLALDALAGKAVRATGSGSILSAPAKAEMIVDARGRFVRKTAGPINVESRFDGADAWRRDLGGEITHLRGGDSRDDLFTAWAIAGHWFRPGAPIDFKPAPASAAATSSPITLEFSIDHGHVAGHVEVDTASWLPRRWSAGHAESAISIDLSDWKDASGSRWPGTVLITSSSQSDSYAFDRVEVLSPANDQEFAKPTGDEVTAVFDPALPAALAIERTPTGHLLVQAAINAQETGWFIFDTGAGINCVSNAAAEKLGLVQIASVPAKGVGGTKQSPLYRPDSIAVGPMTLRHALVMGLDLSFLTAPMGREISGIVGFGFIARAVAETNMTDAKVSLHDPATYSLPGARWEDLAVIDRIPAVHCTFDGGEGLFRLDTGAANSTVAFHQPTVERLHLLDGRDATDTMLGGVGGLVKAKAATIAHFTVGGVRHEKVKASFALEPKGAFANPDLDGNIGGELLRNLTLVTDYSHERIAFIPK